MAFRSRLSSLWHAEQRGTEPHRGRQTRQRSRQRRRRDERLFAESLEGRAMLATITQVESILPPGTIVGIGQSIPFEVQYDAPVTVVGTPVAYVNVQKADLSQATAIFTGVKGNGTILGFTYTVTAGDVTPGNPAQFDVLTIPTDFIVGGNVRNANTLVPADRGVSAADATMADMNAGLIASGAFPPTPTVSPTVYVNPTVWQAGTWAALHPDYFVVRGTAGTGPLATGQVLTVTINGATYRADSTSAKVPGDFHVDANGEWAVYIRSVGGQPATIPFSGFLAPWSTTDSDAYNVIATVTDAAGNSRTDGTTSEIVIDMIEPTLTNVFSTTPAGTYTIGDVLNIYVEYDEPMRVVGNPSLAINVVPQPKTATFVGVSGNRLNFEYVVQPGDSVAALDYVDANSLQLNGGYIEDLAANEAPTTLSAPVPVLPGPPPTQPSLSGQKVISIDTTIATVNAAIGVDSLDPDGIYTVNGPTITITVPFSKPVFVGGGGNPRLELNSAPGRYATYVTGSGTNTLSFEYQVLANDTTNGGRLDYVSTAALDLNGGFIRDALGNNAVLTLPAPGAAGSLAGNKNLQVVTAPRVVQVSSPDPAGLYTAGDTVRIRVLFNNQVVVASGLAPRLELNTSPTTAVATFARYINLLGNPSDIPTNMLEFDYVVQPNDTTNGGFLNYISPASLILGAGINYRWAGPAVPNILAINKTLPAPVSSQNVLLNAQIEIGPDSVAPAAPQLGLTGNTGLLPGGQIARTSAVTASALEASFGTTWEYRYFFNGSWSGWLAGGPISATGTGTFTLPTSGPVTVYPAGTVEARQRDWSGNLSVLGANVEPWTIDTIAPVMTALSAPAGTYLPGQVITITATFSEPVVANNTNPTLTLNSGGVARLQPSSTLSTTLAFTYQVPPGAVAPGGTVAVTGVNLNGGVISDRAGNPFVPALPAPGTAVVLPGVQFDQTAPQVTSITATAGTYGPGSTVALTVNFNEPVNVTGTTARLLLNSAAGRAATLTAAVPPGSRSMTFSYVVQIGDSTPLLQVNAVNLNGTVVRDVAGNLWNGSLPSSPLTVTGPVVIDAAVRAFSSSFSSTPPGPTVQESVINLPIQFTTPVRNFGIGALRLFLNGRALSLRGAWLTGEGANYNLRFPSTTTALLGQYRLEINGQATGVASVSGNVPMTQVSNIYWQKGVSQPNPPTNFVTLGPNLAYDQATGHLYASGVKVTYNGSPVVYPNAAWDFRAAGTYQGENTVVLQASTGQLRLWRFDSGWVFTRGEGFYAPATSTHGAIEIGFNTDFDNNGVIGSATTTIEAIGGVTLTYDANRHLKANGTTVTFNGSPVTVDPSPTATWKFLAADVIDGVNTIVLQHSSGNLRLWELNGSWVQLNGKGWYAPGSAGYRETELAFGMDFNSDGVVGPIESTGSVVLGVDSNGNLRANGTLVTFGGSPVKYDPSPTAVWKFLAADVFEGVNTIVLQHSSGFLRLWRMNASWAQQSGEGWYAPGSPGYLALEAAFGMDFDESGGVGV